MNTREKNRAVRILMKMGLFLIAMIFVFFLSYFCVSRLYGSYLDNKDKKTQEKEQEKAQEQAEESVQSCEFTAVYLDDTDTEKVEYCLLRVFNRATGQMSVFQIPTDSKVALMGDVYNEIYAAAGVPVERLLSLSDLGNYFTDRNTKYQMIKLVLEDLIGGIEISSYEAVTFTDLMNLIDQTEPVTVNLSQIIEYRDEFGNNKKLAPNTDYQVDGHMALGILTYDDGFGSGDSGRISRTAEYLTEFVTAMTGKYTQAEMRSFLDAYYAVCMVPETKDITDDYVKDCLALTEENFSFYTLKGTQTDEAFELDPEKIQNDMKILMGEEAYEMLVSSEGKTEQENEEGQQTEPISSKDKSIIIYNGAKISGIAGKWREKLESDGYLIQNVGNYEEGTLDNGKIIVKEQGMGQDLKETYFPNAEISVGTPAEGADIQIILGRSEDF